MAFKIFNIGKANEEVTRLEVENEKLTKELAAVKENSTQIETAAEKLKTDLAASQGEVKNLQGQITQKDSDLKAASDSITKLTGELTTANATISNPEGHIQQQIKAGSAVGAAAIAASQGIPALANAPKENATETNKTKSDLKGYARVAAAFQKQAEQVMGRKL